MNVMDFADYFGIGGFSTEVERLRRRAWILHEGMSSKIEALYGLSLTKDSNHWCLDIPTYRLLISCWKSLMSLLGPSNPA